MDFSPPKISDLLNQRIKAIQSRLPIRMSVPVQQNSTPFSTILEEANASTSVNLAPVDKNVQKQLLSLTELSPSGELLPSGLAEATSGQSTWPRLNSVQLQAIMPRIDSAITQSAKTAGIDPLLLRALIRHESSFQPFALSSAGAMGLTQLMPGTAGDLGITKPYDIEENVDGGARFLRTQLDAFNGDLRLALAAYNAGPNAVRAHNGVPPFEETRTFIERVLGSYDIYREAGL